VARGLVYGSSGATWQLSDPSYRRLFEREAAILFTEDDLLWWRLRPTPDSGLRFGHADRIIDFARGRGMLVFGAHLVWDEGFGKGWTDADLWQIDEKRARDLMIGTIDAVLARYRGKVAAWSVVNEAIDSSGLRSDVSWYTTVGPSYVADSFRAARAADPDALLVLNEFGFETDGYDLAADKRAATLKVLDDLLGADVPVDALGVQAHLQAGAFLHGFDPEAYRKFLSDVASRGVKILITELDVLDDGLPTDFKKRDRGVAEIYRKYLHTALDEPEIISVMTFGLTDRYTWLQEDYPRKDGAPRRPLPFDDQMKPTPALGALHDSLATAPRRPAFWLPPRCSG
jgi:endo-1,4-beta-xylanase